jgi:microcin C transport system permease protein
MDAPKTLGQRRWRNFKANKRAYWSMILFAVLYGISLLAEVVANDHPLLVSYQGHLRAPFLTFYSEADFGGDFRTEANYRDPIVQCLIVSGGMVDCFDEPETTVQAAGLGRLDGAEGFHKGWIVWPPIPFKFNTINDLGGAAAPSAPDSAHWLGTDDTSRDVLARVIYGFRISVSFGLLVSFLTSVIGIAAGAVQGYFGGLTDLVFQRVIEIWSSTPSLYAIIIVGAIWKMSFALLLTLIVFFGWMGLTGLIRAEFLRTRNFEYVRAARALGVADRVIMVRHLLPNAMVSTLTMLPFVVVGAIGTLTGLDYLGYGLPPSYPSLGELASQAQGNLQAKHLTFAAFTSSAIMLCLLIFIFEGVRDAFDPRKTFQ